MQTSTTLLDELIGPVLRAFTQPNTEHVHAVIEQARGAAQQASAVLDRHGQSVDQASFDLGVATTIVRVFDTNTQKRRLSDLCAVAHTVPQGLQTLQEIARCNALGTQPTQQELADRLRVDRGNFNRRIRKLTHLGLIDSKRRRQALVYGLTALGEEIAQARMVKEPTLVAELREPTG